MTVTQTMLLEYLREVGEQELPEIALAADLHEVTVRRKLDGLVFQGKLIRIPGKRGKGGHPCSYAVAP